MPLFPPAPLVDPGLNDFRLTGISGIPVMTSDNTALGTIYLTPYKGNQIALYDGAYWTLWPSAEISLAVTGRTTDLPFDVFVYSNAGVLTLDFVNWTNATTRATALTNQDGVLVNSGDASRRYVGTCRPRSATTYSWVLAGSNNPSRMDLWNVSNTVSVPFRCITTSNSWNYTTAAWRQAQGSVNYQVDVVAGVETPIEVKVVGTSSNTSALSSPAREVGVGIDSTTVNSAISGSTAQGSSIRNDQQAIYQGFIGIGRHFAAWLEISDAPALTTTTWYGDNGGSRMQTGMTGSWSC